MAGQAIEDVADPRTEQRSFRETFRQSFRTNEPRGQAAIAAAILFLVTPTLAVFISPWVLVLVIPAALLSAVGLRSAAGGSGSAGRLGATGLVVTFNGIALILGLFIAGFIYDFFVSGENPHETQAVAFGFTTVHVMLGVGLLLYDNYRHARGS